MAFSPVLDSVTKLAKLHSSPVIQDARYRHYASILTGLQYREGPVAALWSAMADVQERQPAGRRKGAQRQALFRLSKPF